MIEDALNTAQSISNFGMLAVTAGFFLVLSAILMVTCFRWFMRVINNTMDNQKKAMEELVTETKSQNDKLDDIAEGLKVETQLRVKTISGLVFDLGVETAVKMIEQVRTENHIVDKDATERKIRSLCTNVHDDRNSKLDCFTYRGKKLSTYTDDKWIDWVAEVVKNEVYSDHEQRLVRTNVETIYAKIKLEFYKNINL